MTKSKYKGHSKCRAGPSRKRYPEVDWSKMDKLIEHFNKKCGKGGVSTADIGVKASKISSTKFEAFALGFLFCVTLYKYNMMPKKAMKRMRSSPLCINDPMYR